MLPLRVSRIQPKWILVKTGKAVWQKTPNTVPVPVLESANPEAN